MTVEEFKAKLLKLAYWVGAIVAVIAIVYEIFFKQKG